MGENCKFSAAGHFHPAWVDQWPTINIHIWNHERLFSRENFKMCLNLPEASPFHLTSQPSKWMMPVLQYWKNIWLSKMSVHVWHYYLLNYYLKACSDMFFIAKTIAKKYFLPRPVLVIFGELEFSWKLPFLQNPWTGEISSPFPSLLSRHCHGELGTFNSEEEKMLTQTHNWSVSNRVMSGVWPGLTRGASDLADQQENRTEMKIIWKDIQHLYEEQMRKVSFLEF